MEDYKIYPKQFQYEKIIIERNKCFMIVPFDDNFNRIYGIIKDEASKQEVLCICADEMNGSQPIVNKIIKGILESQYIIVDLTNARPNVLYELGIAHSFRDARNILLLKQKNTDYPFDISHLPYHEYDPNNIFQLRTIISDFIKDSHSITDFRDALAANDIYDYSINDSSNFIEYIENYFKENIVIYSHILNQNILNYDNEVIEDAFVKFQSLIADTLSKRYTAIFDGIIRIYIKLIERCNIEEISLKFAARFSDNLLIYGLEDDTIRITKETDLMLSLANANKLMDFCLPWIIGYFSKSKSSSIDLNRYKLENFLMNTQNETINATIVNSIFNNDCHIREHMADIIGAKRINNSFETLKKQLVLEENWFTIGSLVEAIGRVAPSEEGLFAIESWINENGKKLIEEKQFFLLKHLQHGIVLLEKNGSTHLNNFRIKFEKYMHENQVGPID